MLQHNGLAWFSLYKQCRYWLYVTCHFKSSFSLGGTRQIHRSAYRCQRKTMCIDLTCAIIIPETEPSVPLFPQKGTGNIPHFYQLHKFYSFLFTAVSKHKIRVGKKFFLTFLQLRVRNLFSSSEGTKPVHGISLELSSFPQRRKSGSQIMNTFLLRQSDVRSPERIFATAAPQDNCYSEPGWAGTQLVPQAFLRGVWLCAATGCGYVSTIQPQAAPICYRSVREVFTQTEELLSIARFFTSQFSSSGKKNEAQSGMGQTPADRERASWICIST